MMKSLIGSGALRRPSPAVSTERVCSDAEQRSKTLPPPGNLWQRACGRTTAFPTIGGCSF